MYLRTREKNDLNTSTLQVAVPLIVLFALRRKQIIIYVPIAALICQRKKHRYDQKKIIFLSLGDMQGFSALSVAYQYSMKNKPSYSEFERRTKSEKRMGNNASRMDCSYCLNRCRYLFHF